MPSPSKERQVGSGVLHRMGDVSSHAGAGLVVAGAVVSWVVVGAAIGSPDWWATVLYTLSASITLVMVFAIQHSQARQQSRGRPGRPA